MLPSAEFREVLTGPPRPACLQVRRTQPTALPGGRAVSLPPAFSDLDLAVCTLADELIREVTINCAERGLLLLRVRDEIRMTIAAYQTLYESSVAFGMRKALQAEQGKSDMERKVSGFTRSLRASASLLSTSGPQPVTPAPNSGLRGCSPITSVRTVWFSVMAGPGVTELSLLGQALPVTGLPLGGSTDPGNALGRAAVSQVPSTQGLTPPHPLGDVAG